MLIILPPSETKLPPPEVGSPPSAGPWSTPVLVGAGIPFFPSASVGWISSSSRPAPSARESRLPPQRGALASSDAEALVGALEKANSFAHAKTVIGLLEEVPSLSNDQLDRMTAAAKDYDQVSGSWGVSERIDALVAKHRPKPVTAADVSVDDIPF